MKGRSPASVEVALRVWYGLPRSAAIQTFPFLRLFSLAFPTTGV